MKPCEIINCPRHPTVKKRPIESDSADESTQTVKYVAADNADFPNENDIDIDLVSREMEESDRENNTDKNTDNQFTLPPKRHTAKTNHTYITQPTPSISLNNNFQPLAGQSAEATPPVDSDREVLPPTERVNHVMVKITGNVSKTCQEITAMVQTQPDFKISGEYVKVHFKSIEDYRTGTREKKIKNIGYYIISPIKSRPLKVVLKGLPTHYSTDDLHKGLKDMGHAVERVAQLKRFRDGYPLPMFQVQITQKPQMDKIYELTRFDYLTVTVEKFEKSGRVPQCYNCQSFYHSSSNCNPTPKCVKCGNEHESRSCKKTKEELPTCANCNGPHPASYRACPKFPKWRRSQDTNRNASNTRFNHVNENRPTFARREHVWGTQNRPTQNTRTTTFQNNTSQNITPPTQAPQQVQVNNTPTHPSIEQLFQTINNLSALLAELRKEISELKRDRDISKT